MSQSTPLEPWNGATSTARSYESIPDPDDPDGFSHPAHHTSWPCSRRGASLRIILSMTVIGLIGLGFFARLGSYPTNDKAHQETVVPTLLSVVHPTNKTLIYALGNPLYAQLQEAEILPLEQANRLQWKDAELPKLWLDKTKILPGDALTVHWTLGRVAETGAVFLQDDADIIALYCDESHSFLEAATILQIKSTSEFHGGANGQDSWYIPSFPTLRQAKCHFRLYAASLSSRRNEPSDSTYTAGSQRTQQYVHITSSEPLEIINAKEVPTSIHLALTNEPSRMIVHFTTGDVIGSTTVPVARISTTATNETTVSSLLSSSRSRIAVGTTDTYTSDDMCQAPGNLTQAGMFYPPGMLHTIELNHLRPNTEYRYQVGLQQTNGTILVWSDEYTFRTAPKEGDPTPFSYVVYGDQGCPHLGWKGGQEWLEAMLRREKHITSVHHFGDISYARGAAHVWDNWFQMVEPMTARVPLMVAIGNHEYDHTDGGGSGKDPSGVETAHGFMPSWGNFGGDSGGECGVPMAKRFQMPASTRSNGVFWYSFNYGIVHTIIVSSEHDLSQGSPQYEFLEHDLSTVDRTKTPWVVLESHRPLYEAEGSGSWWRQNLVGRAMRNEFEDLLVAHQVDLVLAGHYHEYQRTCDGLYKGQCSKGGPIHITVGTAGAKLDDGFNLVNEWTAHFIKGNFGYGRITVANHTDMHFEFVLHGTGENSGGKVQDDVWIHRDR